VPLGDDQVRDNRHMKFNPTSVKLHNWFCTIKKSRISTNISTKCKEEWVENCCEGGLGIVKSPCQRKK